MSELFNREFFGSQLKTLRERRGLTQTDLANELNVRQTTISNWENAIREPDTIGEVINIARFFNVDLSLLIDDVTNNDTIYGNHKANLAYFSDNPELLKLYKNIHDNESLQLLFDSASDLSPEDLESVLIHIQGIRKARGLD